MGHWYDKDGNPCHFQEKKGGGQRDTTLRDARKLNLFPSVTEVINIAAKPGLEAWKINQTLLAALTLPRVDGESVDDLAARVRMDSQEQMLKARDLGTAIHSSLEQYAKDGGFDPDHALIVTSVNDTISEYTGFSIDAFDSEKSFSAPAGYGGMIDLSGHGFVIDYKTKEFSEEDTKKRMAWDEQGMQLSAYAHGIGCPDARKLNIYISTSNPGIVHIYEWEEDLYPRFECLLRYWQLTKDYAPIK